MAGYKSFRKAEDQINDKKNELVEEDGDKLEYWAVKVLGHEIEINPDEKNALFFLGNIFFFFSSKQVTWQI